MVCVDYEHTVTDFAMERATEFYGYPRARLVRTTQLELPRSFGTSVDDGGWVLALRFIDACRVLSQHHVRQVRSYRFGPKATGRPRLDNRDEYSVRDHRVRPPRDNLVHNYNPSGIIVTSLDCRV